MKKNIAFILASFVLLLATLAANFLIAVIPGESPHVFGLILSLLFAASFLAFPLLSKNSKGLIIFYLCCMVLTLLNSIVVFFANRAGLELYYPEELTILFAIPLTPFYGITFGGYISDFYYPAIAIFSALCIALYSYLLLKQKKLQTIK